MCRRSNSEGRIRRCYACTSSSLLVARFNRILRVIDEGQDFGKVFLTIVAEEIVVGHTTSSGTVAKVILELATVEHNFVLTSPVNSK